jgi:general secretion pathway protein B
MSYILDALKRADAERQRGHVPGLHTRSSPELDAQPSESTRIDTRRRWVQLLLAMLLVLGALWWWLGAEPADPAPAALVASPTPSGQPEAASSPPEPALAPTDSTQTSEPAPPPLPILAPAPAPARPPTAAREPAAAPADAKRPAGESATTGSVSGNAAAPAAAPVRSFAELTPEARARLPAVNVSGVTYSKNAALRMLIINGKVVQEGGEIASGLTLETIEQRSAVLNHQGLRYRIGY